MARRPLTPRGDRPYHPETIAGWNALWWARFHGCYEVLEMVGPRGFRKKG
jgi:hypothetical protein